MPNEDEASLEKLRMKEWLRSLEKLRQSAEKIEAAALSESAPSPRAESPAMIELKARRPEWFPSKCAKPALRNIDVMSALPPVVSPVLSQQTGGHTIAAQHSASALINGIPLPYTLERYL